MAIPPTDDEEQQGFEKSEAAQAVERAMAEIGFDDAGVADDDGIDSPVDDADLPDLDVKPIGNQLTRDRELPKISKEKSSDDEAGDDEASSDEPDDRSEGDDADNDDDDDEPEGGDGDGPDESWLAGFSEQDAAALKSAGEHGQQMAARLRTADEMTSLFAPLVDHGKKAGDDVTAAEAARRIMRVYDFAATQPLEYLDWFLGQTGVKPKDVVKRLFPDGDGDGGGEDDDFDIFADEEPEAKAPQKAAAKSAFDPSRPGDAESVNLVRTWASEKNDAGDLRHPHATRLAAEIEFFVGQEVQKGVALSTSVLSRAYEAAVRADPELYSENKVKDAAEKKGADQMARIERSKASASRARRASKAMKSGSEGGRRNTSAPDPNSNLTGFIANQL